MGSAEPTGTTGAGPGDDVWAPIEGVTLDEYARLCAGIVALGIRGEPNVHAWVEGRGVRPGTWDAVTAGWNARLQADQRVRERYARVFAEGSPR
ncbi:MAG: hypothetical protein ACT4PI_16325 [Actinomycetota bacterium]